VKILITSTFVTPFILNDVAILRKHFEVEHLVTSGPMAPFLIALKSWRSDVVFSWFASTYAGIAVGVARIMGRKSLVAVGGVDVALLPEIGYGIWLSPWKSRCAGYALRHTDRVLAVDPFLRTEAMSRARYNGRNIEILPTGYDSSFWRPAGVKEEIVLTVAACDTKTRFKVKGLDILFDAARVLPQQHFLVVGIRNSLIEEINRKAPSNIEIHSALPPEELLRLYQRAKVYCQPSRVEGLPNAVCEAMLCGCIPVCSDAGGSRTAVGGDGFLVPPGDGTLLAGAIMKAMALPDSRGLEGRDSIARRFTLERREEGLVRAVNEVLG